MIRVESISSENGRCLAGRVLPGEDLFKGIRQICEEFYINYGVITTLIGSLKQGNMVHVMENAEKSMGIEYSRPKKIEGPLEILCGQGFIGKGEQDEFEIHLHGLLVDSNLRIYGGHFIPEGNTVLATAEIMIQTVEDASFIRKFDQETGFPLFHFIQK